MNIKLFAVAAVAALGLSATAALADTVTITASATPFSPTITGGLGFTMITDFDTIYDTADFSITGLQLFTENQGIAAPPLDDHTQYEGIQVGTPFTITDLHGSLTALSFYMGSPDGNTDGTGSPQNNLTLTFNGSTSITLHGPDIWGGTAVNPGNGHQDTGYLITYTFSPDVHSVSFSETGAPAFEIDNVSGISVPEPASWALMIVGFGAAGAMLRGKRRQAATA